jgi:hypothetical protein
MSKGVPMAAKFFDCGLTKQELMKRAFRIKPVAPNLPRDLALPDDLRQKFTELHFVMPCDLELGTLDDHPVLEEKASMLKAERTIPLVLHARGNNFMPVISELLAAVPPDLLYTVTAFSAEPDKAQPYEPDGRQRAQVTFYTGELPDKIRNQHILYDGRAYYPGPRTMEELERIPVNKPLQLRLPGR